MSKIVDLLNSKASDLEHIASEKDWQMVKQAAKVELAANGVEEDTAEEMLEKLAAEASPNRELELEHFARYRELSDVLVKTAAYISELEVKLTDKDKEIADLEKAASLTEKAPSLEALSPALDQNDLDQLSELEPNTLEKLASFTQAPISSMGQPAHQASSEVDSLLAFCLS